MHKYDYEYWKELDELTWRQAKKFAKMTILTLIGVLIWAAMQLPRLVDFVRDRWDSAHEDQIMFEKESEERFNNWKETGHI